ncbi:hypothetical protein OJ998_20440 [Solirubrobacter taibaiensis]|nr:hypothetical protein [Solirubrobacter taibaiensis]
MFLRALVVLVALLVAPAAHADGPPTLVRDLRTGAGSGSPHDLVAFKGALYFTAADNTGLGLWRTDGTDVTLVQRIDGGAGFAVVGNVLYLPLLDTLWRTDGGTPTPVKNVRASGLTAFGGQLYFIVNGQELWRSDGTAVGTVPVRTFTTLRSLTAAGPFLYLVADNALWRTDGTTTLNLGTSAPTMLTAFGGQLIFAANGGELRRSDGATTTLIEDWPGSNIAYATPLGDRLYFAAAGGLWRTDGTTAEPVPGVAEPRYLTAVGGRLLFGATGGLWRTDGTTAPVPVHPIDPLPDGDGGRERFTVADGRAFFQGVDGATGSELWRSDGTTATRVADIDPGPSGSQPEDMTVAGARLFFSASQAGIGTELWSLVLGPTADLAVTLSAAGTTLTVTVRNLGPEPTTGVRVQVGDEVWAVGALASSATATLERTVPGEAVVTARSLGSDLPDPVPGNDAMTIAMGPGIRVAGACTLVSAIVAANTDAPAGGCPAGDGADTITLSTGSVHSLSAAFDNATALPSITSDITIAGHGGVIQRSGGGQDVRVFRVPAGGALALRNLTVRGGSSTQSGGTILVTGNGRLTLEDARIDGGIAPNGGAIASLSGDVTLIRTVVTDGTAINGGGIYASGGALTLVDSTVTANRATHPVSIPFGGGIYANATLTITRGAINANSAYDGGGLVTLGTATISDATIAGNTASFYGGIDNRGTLTIQRSTLVANGVSSGFSGVAALRLIDSTVSGAAVESDSGTLAVESSTIVGGVLRNATVTGSIAPQCAGTITDGGGNTGCGVDPRLGPLADNGGLTRTHAPLPGSPAIDRGTGCGAADQRGVARPLDGDGDGAAQCDAGAVEAPAVPVMAVPVAGPPPVLKPVALKPATGITGIPSKLIAKGATVAVGTAKNPPVASTTQTLTTRSGASAVLARGTTRIPNGGKRRLTLKLTPAGKRLIKRKAVKVRLRIVAVSPDGTRATITRTVRARRS